MNATCDAAKNWNGKKAASAALSCKGTVSDVAAVGKILQQSRPGSFGPFAGVFPSEQQECAAGLAILSSAALSAQ